VRLPGRGMSWKELLVGLKDEISNDGITDLAATVTYYGVLALFPFLLFLVAVASLVVTPDDAERLVNALAGVAPGPVTQILGDQIRTVAQQQNPTLVGFGALGAVWAASGGVMAVIRALNVAYDVKEGRPFWKVRGIALLGTIVSSVLALAAALIAIGAAPLASRVGGPLGLAIGYLRLPVAGLAMMLLWAVLYYALPDVQQRFKFITPGSVLGVVVWVLASWGFSKYVANFGSYDKTYGALGGVIVLFLWMWISSLVLLVGAEVNALIEHRSPEGKRQGAKSMAQAGTAPIATSPARGEPMRAGGAARPAPPPGRPRLAGLAAIAAGFVAGAVLARRRAA
jgi:membrane protein